MADTSQTSKSKLHQKLILEIERYLSNEEFADVLHTCICKIPKKKTVSHFSDLVTSLMKNDWPVSWIHDYKELKEIFLKLDRRDILHIMDLYTGQMSQAQDNSKEEFFEQVQELTDQYKESVHQTYVRQLERLFPALSLKIVGKQHTWAEDCIRNNRMPHIGSGFNTSSQRSSQSLPDVSEDIKLTIEDDIMKLFDDLNHCKQNMLENPKVLFLVASTESEQHGHNFQLETLVNKCDVLSDFIMLYKEDSKAFVDIHVVCSTEDMRKKSKEFLVSVQKDKFSRAVIFFYGHSPEAAASEAFQEIGLSGGWCCLEDGGMSTDEFEDHIAENILKDVHVLLIISQCFGNSHEQSEIGSKLIVTNFTQTGVDHEYVSYVPTIYDEGTGQPTVWCHCELQTHFIQLNKIQEHVTTKSTAEISKSCNQKTKSTAEIGKKD